MTTNRNIVAVLAIAAVALAGLVGFELEDG